MADVQKCICNIWRAKMYLMQKCIWCRNTFWRTFSKVKCSAPNAFLHQMHFCIKKTFEKCTLNILQSQMYALFFYYVKKHQIHFCTAFVFTTWKHSSTKYIFASNTFLQSTKFIFATIVLHFAMQNAYTHVFKHFYKVVFDAKENLQHIIFCKALV